MSKTALVDGSGASPAKRDSVCSDAWVAELESALHKLWTVWESVPVEITRPNRDKWDSIEATLEKAIATERGRSATASDQRPGPQ
jgi:hypothetical protein